VVRAVAGVAVPFGRAMTGTLALAVTQSARRDLKRLDLGRASLAHDNTVACVAARVRRG
jgi:hypothetical protein